MLYIYTHIHNHSHLYYRAAAFYQSTKLKKKFEIILWKTLINKLIQLIPVKKKMLKIFKLKF